jgi:hypothetical protein
VEDIALLCNLYADGPRTLRRLREEGWTSCASLLEAQPLEIARAVGCSPASAERLLLEARRLVDRLGDGLETEEGGSLLAVESPLRDRVAVPSAPVSAGSRGAPLHPSKLSPNFETLEAPSPPPLEEVDGLDPGSRDRLLAAGLRNLHELMECDSFVLSQQTGLSYTRLMRLQLVARRRAAELARGGSTSTEAQLAEGSKRVSLAETQFFAAQPALESELEKLRSKQRGAEGDAIGGPFSG